MTTRTIKTTVTFRNSFTLGNYEEVLPAGTYDVETDEELLEGLSFHAYRRILTLIHLPAKRMAPGYTRMLIIDPDELDAALKRDRSDNNAPRDGESVQRSSSGTTPRMRETEVDRRAIDRAKDEGMTIPSD